MLIKIALSIGLFMAGTSNSNEEILCEVYDLESQGFEQIGNYPEYVCENIFRVIPNLFRSYTSHNISSLLFDVPAINNPIEQLILTAAAWQEFGGEELELQFGMQLQALGDVTNKNKDGALEILMSHLGG